MSRYAILLPVVVGLLLVPSWGRGADQDGAIVVESALIRLIEQVEAPARAAGVLATLEVAEGDSVEEGALLALVDRKHAELLYERARVELRISEEQAEDDVAVRATEEARKFAQSQLERFERAFENLPGSISQAELEKTRLDFAQATLENERARREFEQLQLQAELKRRELELSQHNVELHNIPAPVPGVVVEILRRRGEWVEPGDMVLRILRTDRLRAEGLASVGDLPPRLEGAEASIVVAVPGGPEVRRTGRVTFVSPEVNAVNGQVRLWAEFDNADGVVRPGLRATMTIHP